jgi:hypothetical protein
MPTHAPFNHIVPMKFNYIYFSCMCLNYENPKDMTSLLITFLVLLGVQYLGSVVMLSCSTHNDYMLMKVMMTNDYFKDD